MNIHTHIYIYIYIYMCVYIYTTPSMNPSTHKTMYTYTHTCICIYIIYYIYIYGKKHFPTPPYHLLPCPRIFDRLLEVKMGEFFKFDHGFGQLSSRAVQIRGRIFDPTQTFCVKVFFLQKQNCQCQDSIRRPANFEGI